MATNFFDSVLKSLKNEYAQVAEKGVIAGDVDEYYDTGSYVLNALVSGSIYKGFPKNKIIGLAGESTTGKTFFILTAAKQFLKDNPTGAIFFFESESAISKKMLVAFGIDVSRTYVIPVETIQQFRTQAVNIVNQYMDQPKSERPPLMMVLDSLGMLSTTKEVEDIAAGSETKDMTRTQLIRGAFRVLTLKLGRAGIPLVMSNHTYKTFDLYSADEVAGGGGFKYAASIIITLSKRKEKDGKEIIGNVIHCRMFKGRLTKENEMVDTLIRYDTGLDRWYGMMTMATDSGAFGKAGSYIVLPDGSKKYASIIMKDREKYFTPDVMKKIDEYCASRFLYGNSAPELIVEDVAQEGN